MQETRLHRARLAVRNAAENYARCIVVGGRFGGTSSTREPAGHSSPGLPLVASSSLIFILLGLGAAIVGGLVWTCELFQLNIRAQHVLDTRGLNSFNSV